MKTKTMIIMITILGMLGLFSCKSADEGLRGGFMPEKDGLQPRIKAAFITNVSELEVGEDLLVEFYYGLFTTYDDNYDETMFDNYTKIWLHNRTEKVEIKTIHDFTVQNYPWTYDFNAITSGAHETILIPGAMFTGDKGSIGVTVSTYVIEHEGDQPKSVEAGGIHIYYRVLNGRIYLSKAPFITNNW